MRSIAITLDDTKAFPKNTEVEAELTFATDAPPKGEFVRDISPDPHAMTVRERISFIELPGPGFVPRRFVPRAGYFATGYRDYTAPLGEPLDQLFIVRHRLDQAGPALHGRLQSGCRRFSIMWIAAPRSRCGPRCLKARDGGMTLFRQRAGRREHFESTCCPKVRIRWMCATTSFSGFTDTRGDGATARRLPIRAPARSLRAMSLWVRCERGRITSSPKRSCRLYATGSSGKCSR